MTVSVQIMLYISLSKYLDNIWIRYLALRCIIVFPFLAFPVTGMVNIGDFYSVSYSVFAGEVNPLGKHSFG